MADTPNIDFSPFNSKMDVLIAALQENTKALSGGVEKKKTDEDKATETLRKLAGPVGDLIDDFGELARSSLSLAKTIGTTAVDAVRLETKARANVAAQLTRDINIAASLEQIRAVYTSAADAFVNVPAGMQLSTDASAEFASKLKQIFGAEFVLTANSLRNFGLLGLDTTDKLEAFMKSTGRAALSTRQQESVISKNMISMMLFGNRVTESAIELERVGLSLDTFRNIQLGIVSDLPGVLDTVNQLNQLGATIDFGELARLSEIPDNGAELNKYLQKTIPQDLFNVSNSFQALVQQLPGVSVELLKRGSAVQPMKTLEEQLTEIAKPDGVMDKFAAALLRGTKAAEAAQNVPGASAVGSVVGSVLKGAGALALGALVPIAAGSGAFSWAAPFLAAGSAALGKEALFGNDVISSGYGNRTLLTPKGSIALNNDDTVIAGTNLGRNTNNTDTATLIRKVDTLVETLTSAKTVINVDGGYQAIPRYAVAGVGVNNRYDKSKV